MSGRFRKPARRFSPVCNAPPAPFVPPELHFTPKFALLVGGFAGAEEHAAAIAPITAALSPAVQMVTPIPYVALQTMFDDSAPWGLHNYEKAVYLDELTDDVIEVILEHQARKTSPLSFVPIFVMGGAYAAADPDSNAFGGRRDVRYVVNISGTSPTPEGFDTERRVVAQLLVGSRPVRRGRRWLRQLHVRSRRGASAQHLR